MNHVFVSPHLDDAVFSCGATINHLKEQGNGVTLVNLFSGLARPPYSPVAQTLHETWGSPTDPVALRRREDETATGVLGIGSLIEDIPEAIYRKDQDGHWLYGQDRAMYGDVLDEDSWLVPYFVDRLKALLDLRDHHIYAPLAIGGHVDHCLAFEIGLRLTALGLTVLFYEDFPHAMRPDRYGKRIDSLSEWEVTRWRLDRHHVESKIEAMARYVSQVIAIFGDRDRMARSVVDLAQEAAGRLGAYAERYWRPPSGSPAMSQR